MSAELTPQIYTDVMVDPFVRGFLHRPESPNGQGLVLTHGAGSNCQAPLYWSRLPPLFPQQVFSFCAAICHFVRIVLTGRRLPTMENVIELD